MKFLKNEVITTLTVFFDPFKTFLYKVFYFFLSISIYSYLFYAMPKSRSISKENSSIT